MEQDHPLELQAPLAPLRARWSMLLHHTRNLVQLRKLDAQRSCRKSCQGMLRWARKGPQQVLWLRHQQMIPQKKRARTCP
jgi:hypothetical protein